MSPFDPTSAISARHGIQTLGASRIREVAIAGADIPDVIPMWYGETDQPTAALIRDAAKASLDRGDTFYGPNLGQNVLRDAIAAYSNTHYGTQLTRDNVAVTSGGMVAVMIICETLLAAGDHAIIVTPLWPNLSAAARINGADVSHVPLTFDEQTLRWSLDLEAVEAAVRPATKAIFVNSPNNPTGWMMTEAERDRLAAFAHDRGIWIVSDEVYHRLTYDDRQVAPSFTPLVGPERRIAIVNSFSKAWEMTGFRVGWLTTAPQMMPELQKLLEYNTSSAPTFVEAAALTAVTEGEPLVAEQRARLKANRDRVRQVLGQHPRVTLAEPEAAFYAFFRLEGITDGIAEAKRWLSAAGVGIAPGEAFGDNLNGWFRMCFAVQPEKLEIALERLKKVL